MKTQAWVNAAVASALVLIAASAAAQTDTLKKLKDSGVITMGVRDASGAMFR